MKTLNNIQQVLFAFCIYFASVFMGNSIQAIDLTPEFAKQIGGDDSVFGSDVVTDPSGYSYVTGSFEGTVDFDPSSGETLLTSAGGRDIFLAKYYSSGALIWVKRMGGNSTQWGRSVALDASGNLYLTGYFYSSFDIDPGAGTTTLASAGEDDIFIAKFSSSGSLLWAKKMGSTAHDAGYSVSTDNSGNVYFGCAFNGTVDFDPATGTTLNLTSAGGDDLAIAKYNSSGNLVWAKRLGNSSNNSDLDIYADATGNVFLCTSLSGTIDFDPNIGTLNLASSGGTDMVMAKYNSVGNVQFAKRIGGTSDDYPTGIKTDASDNIYLTGYFRTTVDFDPNAGTTNLSASGDRDIFFAKYSSTGVLSWARKIGSSGADVSNDIGIDVSGNVYIGGYFSGTADFDPNTLFAFNLSATDRDIFVAKYTSTGNLSWAKRMGATGDDDARAISVSNAGNLVFTGTIAATADFDAGAGTSNVSVSGNLDAYICRYLTSGTFGYANSFSGGSDEIINDMITDASGNIYIVGSFMGTTDFDPSGSFTYLTSSGNLDVFIAKYTSSGNLSWAKRIGSAGSDKANAVALDASGNVFVTGTFNGTVDFDPGIETANISSAWDDVFIAKYSNSGNYVIAKSISGGSNDSGNAIAIDPSGNVIVAGYFQSTADFDTSPATSYSRTSAGASDVFFAKYNGSTLNFIWAQAIGGSGSDYIGDIAINSLGDVCITGSFEYTADFDPGVNPLNITAIGFKDAFVGRYSNSTGSLVWAKRMGGTYDEIGMSIATDASNYVYVTGYFKGVVDFDPNVGTQNLTSAGQTDIFIARYNSSGSYSWAKRIGGSSYEEGTSIKIDGSNNLYVTGFFQSTGVDFDPSGGITTLSSAGGSDVFITRFTSAGTFQYAKNMGGTQTDNGTAIAIGASNSIVVAGKFRGTADMDPGAGSLNLTSESVSDLFIARYTQLGGTAEGKTETLEDELPETETTLSVTVYPNPSAGMFQLNLPALEGETMAQVMTLNGQLVYAETINSYTQTLSLNLQDLAAGMYLLVLQNEGQQITQKLIKQ